MWRMRYRGAQVGEVVYTIENSLWHQGSKGKYKAREKFLFDGISPVNSKFYRYKTLEVVFADELNALVVITVKVFYNNI